MYGDVFLGIGGMVLFLVAAYLTYQIARLWKQIADKESKYDLLEALLLDKVAKKKGIDLEKESIKREIYTARKKTFRKKLQEEMFSEMFGKEDKEE